MTSSRHAARSLRRSPRPSRQTAARRRSSGAWAVVPVPVRPAQVAERAPHVAYLDEVALAREHLRGGRAGQAAEAARRALTTLPRGMDAQRLLGLALLELSEARPAAHAFGAVLTSDPVDVVAHVGIAESQELLDGPGSAEAAWERAWDVEPGAANSGTPNVPGIAGRLQTAHRAAGALDVRDGPPSLTRAALARIHLRGRLYEHAAIEARAVLARDPERMDVRLTLAEAYWRGGETELAAVVAGEIRERLPDCVAANLLVAAQWLSEGRDASELIARVQAVDPAGAIAQALFDDREVPALFGSTALPQPAPAPTLDETQPLEVVPVAEPVPEPVPEPVAEPQVRPEAERDEPEEPEPLADPEPETALQPDPDPEPEPEPQPEPEPAQDLMVEPEPEPLPEPQPDPEPLRVLEPEPEPESAPDPEPEPEVQPTAPIAAVGTPATPPTPAADADDRTRGNEAMANSRYLDAITAYGAWLRASRERQAQ